MAKLKDKIQNALDEARMLILGSQVLLGFQFRSAFEPGFDALPRYSQTLKFVGLCLMIAAVGLLMWPGLFHRIVEQGEDTKRMHRFTTQVMEVALLPFALGLGLDLFIAANKLSGLTAGLIAGGASALIALFFWYGLEEIAKARPIERAGEGADMPVHKDESPPTGTKLKDKIKQALTETRVVLPGAQALLGFQFATILMESFDRLPESSKYLHFASLSLVGLSIVFLMTPAAYHRIVERGENTERFHRFCGRMLVSAMIPLALGIAGDLFVVARKITASTVFAGAIALAMIMVFFGLWFGYTAYRRRRKSPAAVQLRVT